MPSRSSLRMKPRPARRAVVVAGIIAFLTMLPVLPLVAPAAEAAPVRSLYDQFADAQTLRFSFGLASDDETPLGATRQPGEPSAFGADSLPGTTWYTFSSRVDADYGLTTAGSPTPTQLAVYTGQAVARLTQVGASRSAFGGDDAALSLHVTAGVTYAVQVASPVDAATERLLVTVHPADDAFAARTPLVVAGDYVSSALPGTGVEAEEPLPFPEPTAGTRWRSLQPAASGTYTLETFGGTQVAVYTGATLPSLRLVGAVSGHDTDPYSRLEVRLSAGVTYAVQVGRPAWGDTGVSVTPTPRDDHFDTPVDITRGQGTVTDVGAAQQADEPVLTADDLWSATTWAALTSPVSAPVDLAVTEPYDPPVLTIWSGDSLGALTLVAGPFTDGAARFDAVAGRVYHVQLRSIPYRLFGTTTVSWSSGRPPTIASYFANANRHARVGSTLVVYGERLGAVTGVTIGGITTRFTLVSQILIQAVVPGRATAGTVVLTYAGGSVTSPALALLPTLDTIAPTSGPVGTVVTVTGSNIPTIVRSVLLGGRDVEVSHVSRGRLTFTVPPGAQSGQIEIAGAHARTRGAFTVTG